MVLDTVALSQSCRYQPKYASYKTIDATILLVFTLAVVLKINNHKINDVFILLISSL